MLTDTHDQDGTLEHRGNACIFNVTSPDHANCRQAELAFEAQRSWGRVQG